MDLKEKIKEIIEKEKKLNHFSVLDSGKCVDLIAQIIENYEYLGKIQRKEESDNQDIPKEKKKAELIFVAAPTGAGKDNLVAKLNYQNQNKNYIELNMDIFRHYFPMFMENLGKMTDRKFALDTNEFSYEIYSTIQEVLLEEYPGTNIIITGTLRDIDWVEEVFKRFKADEQTDYSVKLACLAVPKKASSIAIIHRYLGIVNTQAERLKEYPGTARYTTMEYHDETYERFPKNFKYFEDKFNEQPGKMIDSIEVYTRSKNISDMSEKTKIYSSDESNDKSALDAINELRDKEYKISYESFSLLASKIIRNKDYLKSQGTLREIVKNLAILLNYPKVVEKLDSLDNEPNL